MPSSPEARRGGAPGPREARTSRTLALGVALPTLLLAFGWAFATYRERSLLEEQRRAEIEAMLGSLEQAVDESLEELRAREDERPYYVWGHYYSPPDVLSLTDPVAISPLATGPADPRVVGHFQLASDGRITTPYAEGLLDARAPRAPREERLAGLLAPTLRASLLAALAAEPEPTVADDLEEGADEGEGPTYWASSSSATSSASGWGSPSAATPADEAPRRAARREAPAPQQRVEALELNSYGSQLAQEINLAQQGDPIVRNDLWERGRAAPQVARVTRSAPLEDEGRRSSSTGASRREVAPPAPQNAPVVQAEAAPNDATRAPPIEVEYTPMRIDRLAGVPVLVRTVSDGHSAYLQGVVLDDAYLEGTWLPRLLSRFVVSEPAARLVSADDPDALARCALTRALPIAPSQLVCVDPRALVGPSTSWLTWIERALLALLVLVVVLASRAPTTASRSSSPSIQGRSSRSSSTSSTTRSSTRAPASVVSRSRSRPTRPRRGSSCETAARASPMPRRRASSSASIASSAWRRRTSPARASGSRSSASWSSRTAERSCCETATLAASRCASPCRARAVTRRERAPRPSALRPARPRRHARSASDRGSHLLDGSRRRRGRGGDRSSRS
jgi:hypothetical protein